MNSLRMMPALSFSAALAVGIVMGYYVSAQRFLWLLLAVTAVLTAAGFFLKGSSLRRCFLDAACLFVGIMLMTIQKERIHVPLSDYSVELKAVATEPMHETEKSFSSDFVVLNGFLKNKKIRVYVRKDSGVIFRLGATYSLTGCLRNFDSFVSDGNFDYGKWADSHSLTAQMYVYPDNIVRLEDEMERLPFFRRVVLKSKMLRAELLKSLKASGINGTRHAVVAAMAFGDRSTLSKKVRDMYVRTGVAHLLALSGMHLGVLFMLLTFVLGRLRSRAVSSVIVVVAVWTYVIFVGMPPSVVRAAAMLTIYSLVTLDGREKMSMNALFVTFALMLACNPMMIWDVGFQLSFLAMLSIFLFFPTIYNFLPSEYLFEHPLLRYVWATVTVSLAAQIGTAPLTVYYFGRFSTIFMLTNLVAVPLVTMLLYSVFLLVALSALPFVGQVMLFSVKFFSSLLSSVIGVFASWEWGSIENISINWIQLMLIYAIIAVLTYMSARLIRR